MPPVPFFTPDLIEADYDAVLAVLRSGWITTGRVAEALEHALVAFCHADHAICLSSQTAAAELTLRLLGIAPGDEVLLPAYTYTATASVVCHVGATPILIDCSPDRFTMDIALLEQAITPRTKAILAVDFAGIPCDYAALYALADQARRYFCPNSPLQSALGRIAILSDAAHSLGGSWQETPCGSLADFSCFSFHAVKNLTTAEGGAIVWREQLWLDSPWAKRQLRLLSLHGQSRSALEKEQGNWEYDVLFPGYKCNMTDLSAALGLSQLARYPAMLARRHALIEYYDAALAPLGLLLPLHVSVDYRSSGHLYPLRLPRCTERERNGIIAALGAEGIGCNVHYKPLPLLTAYQNLGFSIKDFPHAWAMYQNEITLPLYSKLTDEQALSVCASVKRVLRLG